MRIQDEELRELFRAESEEHLQRLDEGLLRLESHPDDLTILEEVFREAHSLKGAARMLGVGEVETVAHCFEDVLGTAKRGQSVLSPHVIDCLYRGLDDIRKLVDEAITGNKSGVDVLQVLRALSGEPSPIIPPSPEHQPADHPAGPHGQGSPESVPFPSDDSPHPSEKSSDTGTEPDPRTPGSSTILPAPGPTLEEQPGAEGGEAQASRYRIETIRIDPRKLDVLMTQAGELMVTKIRMARRLAETVHLTAYWEEWSREVSEHRVRSGNGIDMVVPSETMNGAGSRERNRVEKLGILINDLAKTTYEDHQRLEAIARKLEEGIRTARLLPLSTIFQLFRRTVRDMARELSKEVTLITKGEDTTADKQILEEMKDPLMHMIRNAIDHGIETSEERIQAGKARVGTLLLRAYQTATDVIIEVEDDGRGLNLEVIKQTALKQNICREEDLAGMSAMQVQSLIFAPGFSTRSSISNISGRGVGMDVVRTQVERLKGSIRVDSTPGHGCTIQIRLPMTLATTHVLLVSVDQHTYAIPVQYVKTLRLVAPEEIYSIEGRTAITLEGQSLAIIRLSDLLEVRAHKQIASPGRTAPGKGNERIPCVVLTAGDESLACLVDTLLDEHKVVLKPYTGILKRVRNVSGSTILGTGEVCIILNPSDLIRSAQKGFTGSHESSSKNVPIARKAVILLVEDSLTIRTQVKRILEGAGHEVITTTDGVEALSTLKTRTFDAIVSDVQMPNMDGLTLTAAIRGNPLYAHVPIILFTSLSSDEDKRKGMEAGATAYISKVGAGETLLVETVRRLV